MLKGQMNEDTEKTLQEVILHDKPKRLLEFGSGDGSTFKIRKWLRENGCGYLVSLENSKEWYNKLRNKNDRFGSVVYSEFGVYDNMLKYDYELEGVYDLILIDGPAMHDYAKTVLSDKKYWTEPKGGGGIQSFMLLDYVWPHIDEDTKVIVDARLASVYHYLQSRGTQISVYHKGHKPYFAKRHLKKCYHEILNEEKYFLSRCSVITKKPCGKLIKSEVQNNLPSPCFKATGYKRHVSENHRACPVDERAD